MKQEVYRTLSGRLHEIAMSEALGMDLNGPGPDLIDDIKLVEVKGCLVYPESKSCKKNYVKWTLFGHEVNWGNYYDEPLYLAVGTYTLDAPISRLRSTKNNVLEGHIKNRDFKITPWSWAEEFPISTKNKYYDCRYLRPNPDSKTGISKIPEVIHTISMPKGYLHFTEGVDLKHFENIL